MNERWEKRIDGSDPTQFKSFFLVLAKFSRRDHFPSGSGSSARGIISSSKAEDFVLKPQELLLDGGLEAAGKRNRIDVCVNAGFHENLEAFSQEAAAHLQ